MSVTWTIHKGGPAYDFFETFEDALADQTITKSTPTQVVVADHGSKVVFGGAFVDTGGDPGPELGEVNSIKIYKSGVLIASATGYAIDIDDLETPFGAIPDFVPFREFLFNNPEQQPLFFLGSPGRDVWTAGEIVTELYGRGGNDKLTGENAAPDHLSGGAGNDVLVGLGLGDTLIGGKGNDKLTGGDGDDTLTGGSGKDTFTFDIAPGAGNLDEITDLAHGVDKIRLDAALFTGIGAFLTADEFHVGAAANAPGHHIIYDDTNGKLYWDPDGMGGSGQTQFATLDAGLSLSQIDFVMF